MNRHFPKPLFFVILLITVSIIGVSAVLASNSDFGSSKTEVASNNQKVSYTKNLITDNTSQTIQTPTGTTPPQPETLAQSNTETKPEGKKAAPKAVEPKAQIVNTATNTITKLCSGNFNVKFLCLLNEYRASKKLGALTYSNSLANVALNHSIWMNNTQTLAHINSDGIRHNVRCELAGITCRAENLAQGITDAEELLSEWKKSGSHNVNLLGPYTSIGLGISADYITLLFN